MVIFNLTVEATSFCDTQSYCHMFEGSALNPKIILFTQYSVLHAIAGLLNPDHCTFITLYTKCSMAI